jgi:endonuclease G, mitochondrial
MPFAGHLDTTAYRALVQAAADSGLIDIDRRQLFRDIPSAFFNGLPRDPAPLNQFELDLQALDQVERMADGQVPLVFYLQNSAWQLKLRGRAETAVFEKAASAVDNNTRGVPPLPATASLPETKQLQAIIGMDDMVDFAFLRGGATVGASVLRVRVPRFDGGVARLASAGKPWVMLGTAWLIGSELAVTNHHVINARLSGEPPASETDFKRQGLESILEFDVDDSGARGIETKVKEVVASSDDLDYVILRLPAPSERRALRLRPDAIQLNATSYLSVNIIQHPRGQPKRVALRNNLVTSSTNRELRYLTDTDFGSSGAPVCGDDWRVVALHRGAEHTSVSNYKGQDTAYINFGTQVAAILADLRARYEPVWTEVTTAE